MRVKDLEKIVGRSYDTAKMRQAKFIKIIMPKSDSLVWARPTAIQKRPWSPYYIIKYVPLNKKLLFKLCLIYPPVNGKPQTEAIARALLRGDL